MRAVLLFKGNDMSKKTVEPEKQNAIQFWRDERIVKVFIQIALLAAVVFLILSGLSNYRQRGLTFSFRFLNTEASFDLAEGIEFDPSDTYARAFLVGVINTARVAGLGIVFATLLGFFAGVARLSKNWLISKIAGTYVQIIRNTPLLLQLFFLYFGVIIKLPSIKDAITLPGPVYLSNRGVFLPWLQTTESFRIWWPFLLTGFVIAVILFSIRARGYKKTGRPSFNFFIAVSPILIVPVIAWLFIPGNPLAGSIPQLVLLSSGIVKVEGGLSYSPEFTTLLIGLVIYTGAYIAEVVRAGIQAVPFGQTEAARSQGFTRGQVLKLIILPQALRIIIPPLINEYLNLTKNSSLAIAIAFLDLYAVSQTMLNQSGRVVEVFLMIMASYLSFSLLISLIMNIVNKRIQIIER